VRAVAERLLLRQAAGTPSIAISSQQFDLVRSLLGNDGFFIHVASFQIIVKPVDKR
jgi:hypothetical protein